MKLIPTVLALIVAGLVFGAYLGNHPPEPAGDIAEYYGITESLMNHASINLTNDDITNLSNSLHPQYYDNPGYYIWGKNGNRYPVHFFAYSLLLTPIRWCLRIVSAPQLQVFSLFNSLAFFAAIIYIMQKLFRTPKQQWTLLLFSLTSPLIFFLWWPGPDILILSLLLIALSLFLEDRFLPAVLLAAIASWQSQPILVIVGFLTLYHIIVKKNFRAVLPAIGLSVIPYLYNIYTFGTLTPWTLLTDGWTTLNGFGLQNVSLQKLFEQLFDLNIGVFWYAPLLTMFGLWILVKNQLQKGTLYEAKYLWFAGMLVTTLLAFQTNPAWHYGTAGFGPSRHAIVMIPFFIAIMTHAIVQTKRWIVMLGVIVASQIIVLSINNYMFPIFTNTLDHSPIARFVLDRWPSLYSPTPEIFVDRTNHTDLDYPTSAVYKTNGACKKAYVLTQDIDRVIETCGPFTNTPRASIFNQETDGFYVNY